MRVTILENGRLLQGYFIVIARQYATKWVSPPTDIHRIKAAQ